MAEEFEKKFTSFGENTKKYKTFTAPIEKIIRINKNREEITKNISYRLQFLDSARFMASSLSNFVNNCSERIHKIKCKYGHDDKKYELYIKTYRIIAYCDYFLEYTNFKDDLIEYKCVCCNKNYQQV